MSNRNPGNDRGNVLFLTIGAMALIAIAMILSVRAFSLRMEASQRETRATEQRLVGSVAEDTVDKWMASSEWSKYILDQADRDEDFAWMTPLAAPCPNPNPTPPESPETMCWRVRSITDPFATDDLDPADADDAETIKAIEKLVTLRGEEAQREARDVTIEVAVGCYTAPDPPEPTASLEEHCQQITTSGTRRYERAVLFQYQLHYETNLAPQAALDAAWDDLEEAADGLPEDDVDIKTDTRLNSERRPVLILDPDLDRVVDALVVFTSDDKLNGPLRFSGPPHPEDPAELRAVLYCGTPTFRRIETKIDTRPQSVPGCNSTQGISPNWESISTGLCSTPPSWDDGFNCPDRYISKGELKLLVPEERGERPADLLTERITDCVLTIVNYSPPPGPQKPSRSDSCPDDTGVDHVILDGDIIVSTTTLTIQRLVVDGSATLYAEEDITICGPIEARGTNPAGGLNVIALITRTGNVVLDPGLPNCNDPISLKNVAVLAPKGAVYARNWHSECPDARCPELTITGSIAAKHLGLYGIPTFAGDTDHGWSKLFTYPTDFWQARPPWWPGYDDGIEEWAAA